MNKYLIIAAGGTGSRVGGNIPKQFLLLNNLPVIFYSIKKFIDSFEKINIIIALPGEQKEYWEQLRQQYKIIFDCTVVKGGETRTESVYNALQIIDDEGIVAIHDAARPLVSEQTIKEAFMVAEEKGNAVPVIAVEESTRMITPSGNENINRDMLRLVQTPQCFNLSLIKKAYSLINLNDKYTDDASVIEKFGIKINLTKGNKENIKITHPEDLIIAESLMNAIA